MRRRSRRSAFVVFTRLLRALFAPRPRATAGDVGELG